VLTTIILAFIVLYSIHVIHQLGITEQTAIKAHKLKMRQENEAAIAAYAEEVAKKYHD
jgi:hypothetical protein